MVLSSTGPFLLSLVAAFSTVLAQSSCQWKSGRDALDYYPCDSSAAQSQCCRQSEVCVSHGLCYGALGQIYRGACAGGWGNDTACPQFCNDAGDEDGWSNLLKCPLIRANSGESSWWCGDKSVVSPCDETGTNFNPTKAQVFSLPWNGMLPQVMLPVVGSNFTGCAVNQDNPYSVENQIKNAAQYDSGNGSGSGSSANPLSSATPTSSTISGSSATPTSSATPSSSGNSNCSTSSDSNTAASMQQACPNGAQTGEGVAIGVVALVAIAMACWALYERKQKKRLLAGGGIRKHEEHQHQYQQQPYFDTSSKGYMSQAPQYWSPHQPPISEIDSVGNGRRLHAHELQT